MKSKRLILAPILVVLALVVFLFVLRPIQAAPSIRPLTSLQDGLVAYYPFNGNANDESGNGNDGTVMGATLTTDQFGGPNSAYSFDGVNDYIDLGSQNIIDDSATFSVSFWANVTGGSDDGPTMIRLKGNTSEFQYVWRTNTFTGGRLYFGFRQFMGVVSNDNQYLFDNMKDEWHHHVIIYNSGDKNSLGSYQVYVDRVSVPLAFLNTVGGSTNENTLGRDWLSLNYLEGILDEVRIYNRALTEAEIKELFGPVYVYLPIVLKN